MPSFEEVKARATNLLSTVLWARQQLGAMQSPAAAAVNSVVSLAGRDLAAAVGGSLSEYLTGRRRYGSRAARAAVAQGRRLAAQNARNQKRQQAISLLDQVAGLVSELNDPIDWRMRRKLTLAFTRAKAAAQWSTILNRAEAILQELIVYSPPDDDISVVRRLDAQFRRLIEDRLSELGPDWWHTRVPPAVARHAELEAQRRSGGRLPALQYLTFSDYGVIITHPSNWGETFGEFFGERAAFLAKFAELKGLRNDVAHSRLLGAAERSRLRELTVATFTPASR